MAPIGSHVAMDRLEGEPLSHGMKRGEIPMEDLQRMARDILKTVAARHAQDGVHGAIRPDNLVLHRTPEGNTALRLRDRRGRRTASYTAPEVLRGEAPSTRSDLYSVGAVLYECLTGVPPVGADPIAPRVLRPSCPDGLERFVLIALARDPLGRFQSAMEMLGALDDVRSGSLPTRSADRAAMVTADRPATWGESIAWSALVFAAFTTAALATAAALLWL